MLKALTSLNADDRLTVDHIEIGWETRTLVLRDDNGGMYRVSMPDASRRGATEIQHVQDKLIAVMEENKSLTARLEALKWERA